MMRAALLVASASIVSCQSTGTFNIALWGDIPYYKNYDDLVQTPQDIMNSINAEGGIRFSVFDGDTKDGSTPCNGSTLEVMRNVMGSSRIPAVYVPGDNEWTDCHRTNNNASAAAPQDMLNLIRATMFVDNKSFGKQKISLTPLAGYPESNRWVYSGIYFLTLNIPGSNNNYIATDADCTTKSVRTLADCVQTNLEYTTRDAANRAFLSETYDMATAAGAPGIMIIFQDNPGFDEVETSLVESNVTPATSGYANFLSLLYTLVQNFPGQTALVHGDDHQWLVDYPWPGTTVTRSGTLQGGFDKPFPDTRAVKKFVRHCTFGSPNKAWTKCHITPNADPIFTFQPVFVA